jgi:hypothetical protein
MNVVVLELTRHYAIETLKIDARYITDIVSKGIHIRRLI